MKKTLIFAFVMLIAATSQAYLWTYTQAYPAFWDKTATSAVETDFDVDTGAKPAVVLNNGFALTVNGGNITSAAATGTIYMKDGSSLVLNNCTVSNTNTKNKGASAIYVEPGAKVSITINDSTITSEQWGIDLQGASSVTMASGTIDGAEYGIILQAADCSLAITGGQISNIVRMEGVTTIATKPTGGVYKNAPAPFYIPAGYSIAGNTGAYAYLLAKATSVIPLETYTTIDIVKPSGAGNAIKITINGETSSSTKVDLSMLNVNPVQKITVQEVDSEGNNVGEAVEGAAIKVDSTAKDTTVGVPFSGATVNDIFDTATLSAGDTISVYNPETKKYDTYELNEGKTAWEGVKDAETGVTPSTTTEIPRGASVILHRKSPEQPIVLLGATAEEGETVEQTAEATKTTATLTSAIGNPSTEEMDLAEDMVAAESAPKTTTNTVVGDKIIVQAEDGSYTEYLYRNDGWYIKEITTTVNEKTGITISKPTYKKVNPKVKPGRSFFYRSAGGKAKFRK